MRQRFDIYLWVTSKTGHFQCISFARSRIHTPYHMSSTLMSALPCCLIIHTQTPSSCSYSIWLTGNAIPVLTWVIAGSVDMACQGLLSTLEMVGSFSDRNIGPATSYMEHRQIFTCQHINHILFGIHIMPIRIVSWTGLQLLGQIFVSVRSVSETIRFNNLIQL